MKPTTRQKSFSPAILFGYQKVSFPSTGSDTFLCIPGKDLDMTKTSKVYKLVCGALCLAIALVLPLLTGQIPQVGSALCPMHIPVLLSGFLCGPLWGALVGFVAPLLRYVIFGMPPIFPTGISMAFELSAYGVLSGLMYRLLPKKVPCIYISLITAMIGGRLVWGLARFILAGLTGSEFPFSLFLAGAVTEAIPGIILHILLIPVIVMALKKAKLTPS